MIGTGPGNASPNGRVDQHRPEIVSVAVVENAGGVLELAARVVGQVRELEHQGAGTPVNDAEDTAAALPGAVVDHGGAVDVQAVADAIGIDGAAIAAAWSAGLRGLQAPADRAVASEQAVDHVEVGVQAAQR